MKLGNRSSGFTLVELIIALVILSFVMMLCASGFRFGTRVWDRVNVQSEQIDTLQAVQGFLRRSISHSITKDRLLDDLQQQENPQQFVEGLFIGNSNRIKFVSYTPKYGVDDYLYHYELTVDRQASILSLSYYPYNIKLNDNASIQSLAVIDGVKDIEIKYFSGYIDEQTSDSWLSKWDDVYTLPLLVKIDLTFIDNNKHWPELIIPLRNGPYVIR